MPSPHQKLFLITGSSGVGKNAVLDGLIKQYSVLHLVTSATTRWPAREGERFGDAYYFVDDTRFDWLIETHQLIEYTEVYGERYGTLARELERIWSAHQQPITTVDVRGVHNMRRLGFNIEVIYLDFPSSDAQKQRILHRQPSISPQELDERLSAAAEERAWANKESQSGSIHVVINDRLGACVADVARALQLNLS